MPPTAICSTSSSTARATGAPIRYGGSVENRARLLFEVIDAVTKPSGPIASACASRRWASPSAWMIPIPKPCSPCRAELDRRGLAYLHLVEPTVRGREVVREADTRREALMRAIRTAFSGPIILAGGYNRARADKALAEGRGDLIAFGRPFIANPDLPARLALDAPLNEPDPTTFYGGDARGYTDYPTLADAPTDEVVS
jgi:N-ethylmaleimide reductase